MRYFLVALVAVTSFLIGGVIVKEFRKIQQEYTADNSFFDASESKSKEALNALHAFSRSRAKQLHSAPGDSFGGFNAGNQYNFSSSVVPVNGAGHVRYIGPDFDESEENENREESTPAFPPPPLQVLSPSSDSGPYNANSGLVFGGARATNPTAVATFARNKTNPTTAPSLSTPRPTVRTSKTIAATRVASNTEVPTPEPTDERIGIYLFKNLGGDLFDIYLIPENDSDIKIGFEKREKNGSAIQFDEAMDVEIWRNYIDDLVAGIQATSDVLPEGDFNIRFANIPDYSLIIAGGLRAKDTLISINGEQVSTILKSIAPPNDEVQLVEQYVASKSLELLLARDGKARRVIVSRR